MKKSLIGLVCICALILAGCATTNPQKSELTVVVSESSKNSAKDKEAVKNDGKTEDTEFNLAAYLENPFKNSQSPVHLFANEADLKAYFGSEYEYQYEPIENKYNKKARDKRIIAIKDNCAFYYYCRSSDGACSLELICFVPDEKFKYDLYLGCPVSEVVALCGQDYKLGNFGQDYHVMYECRSQSVNGSLNILINSATDTLTGIVLYYEPENK